MNNKSLIKIALKNHVSKNYTKKNEKNDIFSNTFQIAKNNANLISYKITSV